MLLTAGAFTCLMMPAAGHAFDDSQTKDIEQIVKNYLMENPSLVADALKQHQINLAKADEKRRFDAVAKNQKLFKSKTFPSVGNPNADITVVEFSDYNCGYCKRAFADVEKAVKKQKNVRFVFPLVFLLLAYHKKQPYDCSMCNSIY